MNAATGNRAQTAETQRGRAATKRPPRINRRGATTAEAGTGRFFSASLAPLRLNGDRLQARLGSAGV
jgi:hypothetical protein